MGKIGDFYQSNCTKRSVARAEVGQFFLNGFFFLFAYRATITLRRSFALIKQKLKLLQISMSDFVLFSDHNK